MHSMVFVIAVWVVLGIHGWVRVHVSRHVQGHHSGTDRHHVPPSRRVRCAIPRIRWEWGYQWPHICSSTCVLLWCHTDLYGSLSSWWVTGPWWHLLTVVISCWWCQISHKGNLRVWVILQESFQHMCSTLIFSILNLRRLVTRLAWALSGPCNTGLTQGFQLVDV